MYYKIDFNQLLQVDSLGFEHLHEKRRHITRTVPLFIFYVVTAGEMHLLVNGEPITIRKGEVCLFDTSETQAPDGSSDCEYYWCHLHENGITRLSLSDAECRDLIDEKRARCLQTRLNGTESYRYCHVYIKKHFRIRNPALLDYVISVFQKNRFTPEARRAEKRFALSVAVVDMLFHLEDANVVDEQHYLSRRLIKFIEKNYDKNLSAEEFETEFSLGIDHLNRICKRAVGKSIVKFKNALRIDAAREHLTNGISSIEEIAFKVGFENYPYFSRLFKRETGLSPQEYRKLHSVE